MNITADPIFSLQALGYTEREAAFLYLVALYSGYFLRRQFDYFIDRNKGGVVMRFLEKARIAGHIQLLDTAPRRQVYHLFYKPIYRMLGIADSQNRRVKGDADVRTRLMRLDYVLEHDHDRYLTTDEQKIEYFTRLRGIDARRLTYDNGGTLPEIQSTLISVADPVHPAASSVRFIFVDEGLLTTRKFERVVGLLAPLLRALGSFEVVYVASSPHNFAAARMFFHRKFAGPLEVRQPALHPEWRSATRLVETPPLRPQFTTLLLHFPYPKLRRNEPYDFPSMVRGMVRS